MSKPMILRKFLRCKLHRARVTHADKHYEGSVTIPPHLIEAAGMAPNEEIHVWNVTTGARFETYIIKGKPDTKDIAINGAAAHLAKPGDVVILACYQYLAEEQVAEHSPTVVLLDENNNIKEIRPEKVSPHPLP